MRPRSRVAVSGFVRPDRLDHLHDQCGIDQVQRHVADDRIGVLHQRRGPLRRMLVVLPGDAMGRHVGSRCVLELQRFCLFERRLPPCHLARVDRIDVFFAELAAFKRALARFGKRHRDARAEPHVAERDRLLFLVVGSMHRARQSLHRVRAPNSERSTISCRLGTCR